MADTVIVALLSLAGTAIGGFVSVITSTRLTSYKIQELQKQVEKHNEVVERTFRLEEHAAIVDYQLGSADRRLIELEKRVGEAK